jgi:spermidine/putrescine transport system permease protein
MKRTGLSLWLAASGIYFFLYLPIVVVGVYSFNAAKRGGPWRGFATDAYVTLLHSPEKMAALRNTMVLAVASTAISTVLGTLLGYGLDRYAFPAKKLLAGLIYIPVLVPDIVAAIALLIFYSLWREWIGLFELGLTTMILAHITFQLPFVAIVVRARLTNLDPTLEEAAHDLGANAWQKFRHVTWPLMLPGVLAGAALAFTLSIDDFVVSFFTAGPGSTTLPILIYSSVKRGITPDINALSTLIVLVSMAGTIAVTWLRRPPDPGKRVNA